MKLLMTLVCLIALATAPDSFAKNKHKKSGKNPRKPASSLELIEIDDQGTVAVDGETLDIRAGKAKSNWIVARVEGVLPFGETYVPAFRVKPLELRNQDGDVTKLNVTGRTLQADESWKFFENEKSFDADHELNLSFPMSAEQLDSLKGKVVIFPVSENSTADRISISWNECDGAGAVTGNYAEGSNDYPCSQRRFLDDDYAAYLRDHMLGCVSAGTKSAGLGAARKVQIAHDGTEGDAAHKRTPSLHNAGRAIDIQRMIVTTTSGVQKVFDFRQTNTNHVLSGTCAPAASPNCKYYETFRQCWHNLMKARACPGNANPARRWIGTLGWEDKKHIAHHLHTSLPFCPRKGNYWTTAFDDESDADEDSGGLEVVPASERVKLIRPR